MIKMSKTRDGRKVKLNVRTYVIKDKYVCDNCNNGKCHSNGLRYWCTKCKHEEMRLIKK